MFILLRWGGRKVLRRASAHFSWLRAILFLFTVLRWVDRRFHNTGSRIALRKGENLIVSIQKNGNS